MIIILNAFISENYLDHEMHQAGFSLGQSRGGRGEWKVAGLPPPQKRETFSKTRTGGGGNSLTTQNKW